MRASITSGIVLSLEMHAQDVCSHGVGSKTHVPERKALTGGDLEHSSQPKDT